MRIAYIECFSGISGDMTVGALLHAGVREELLHQAVAALNIGAELRVRRVDRSGISATKVDVLVDGKIADRVENSDHGHRHDHAHAHDRNHNHGHMHSHAHGHDHHHHGAAGHRETRSLSTIKNIIRKAEIAAPAQEMAIQAFELLGEAEAGVHNVPIESIHFHEVGAVDTIVDIVCASVGCHALAVDRFLCSPLNVGGGTVVCAHGEFPVPAPATLALLKGAPVYSSGIKSELVTPTGAALIRALNCSFSAFPSMHVELIGYGAGSREFEGRPSVVRISVGEQNYQADVSNGDPRAEFMLANMPSTTRGIPRSDTRV
ncbi:MAG: LarC family nickel insertion protein [Acidobacteriaceae bacterium]|nr:LarC family nickel insertion protein [Acidobacteriaceae bacterium]